MWRPPRNSAFCTAAAIVLLSQIIISIFAAANDRSELIPGTIADVTCSSDATERYTIYLPSNYIASKKWPIIYLFDPGGRGKRPVTLYKDLGEKYGFILAASNNSRNFGSDLSKDLKAVWDDTHSRLAIDERRTDTSGFSGGARVAGAMAMSCTTCQIAGVIAHGAGYPTSKLPGRDKLPYFLAVGNRDFNWPEVMNIRREREEHDLPYRLRIFDGSHQWAPAEVMEDAVSWMILKSMQSGDLAPDQAFINLLFKQCQSEAAEAQTENDLLRQLVALRSLVSDFSPFKDVGEIAKSLAALKSSARFKSALKDEHQQIDEQLRLVSEIAPKIRTYIEGSEPDPASLRTEILQGMGRLNDQSEHAKKETDRLIASRAFGDLWVSSIENGQQELQARHFDKAEACFQLMSQVRNDPWPMLLLADTHAAAGNKKQAIKDVQEAIRRGLKDASILASEPGLQGLKGDAEFQKVLEGLEQNQHTN